MNDHNGASAERDDSSSIQALTPETHNSSSIQALIPEPHIQQEEAAAESCSQDTAAAEAQPLAEEEVEVGEDSCSARKPREEEQQQQEQEQQQEHGSSSRSNSSSGDDTDTANGSFIDIEISHTPLVEQVLSEIRSIKPVLLQTDGASDGEAQGIKSPKSKLLGALGLALSTLNGPFPGLHDVAAPKRPAPKPDSAPSSGSAPFYRLFAFADSLDFALMALGSAGAVINGLSQIMVVLVFGTVTDAFGDVNAKTPIDGHALVAKISKATVHYVFVAMAAAIGGYCEVAFWMCSGERQAARIRSEYLKALLRQDVSFFDRELTSGEVLGRMSGDTASIQRATGEKVGKVIEYMTTFVGGMVLAFAKSWKLSLVLLATIPLIVTFGATTASQISKLNTSGQASYSDAGRVVVEVIGAIRTVMSFTGEKRTVGAYDRALKKAYKVGVRQGLASGFGAGLVGFFAYGSFALSLWYGSRLAVNGSATGGTIITVFFSIVIGGSALGQASLCFSTFAGGQAAAYKLFELINRRPEIDAADPAGISVASVRGDIRLRDVDFSYPARPEVAIFSKLSFQIPAGRTAALVGGSGSGKSTVIQLIERFYDPQGGEVLLDGIDIKTMKVGWLRQQIGLVSQEAVLFGTSIGENIAYGKDGATGDEIKAAARLASAATFIDKMPQGYNTQVGENGVQLSGGQKQRIAIARVILKNPRILLLDEATSALDAASEQVVQQALERIMCDRTTLIVAHRFTTIRTADHIAVMHQGAIVEQGTHAELLSKSDGAYSQLAHHQNVQEEPIGDDDVGDEAEPTVAGAQVVLSRTSSSHSRNHTRSNSASNIILNSCPRTLPAQPDFASDNDLEAGPTVIPKRRYFLRLAALNGPETPMFVIGSAAAAVHGALLPTCGLIFSRLIISFFGNDPHHMKKDASFWAVMLVVLACGNFLVCPIQMFSFAVAGNGLVRRIRLLIFEKILQQEVGWFDEKESSGGSIGARLSQDAARMRSMVGDALSTYVESAAAVLTGLLIAFLSNFLLSSSMLAILPLLGLGTYMQVKLLKGHSKDSKAMYEDASILANEAVSSIRTVASFCAEDKVSSLYQSKCKLPLAGGIRQGLISGSGLAISSFSTYGCNAFIFWLSAHLVREGKTTFNQMFTVFFSIVCTAFGVAQSMGLAPDIARAKTAANSIFALLDRRSKIDSSDTSGSILKDMKGHIEFHHISFTYPTRPDVQVFQDFCLTVKPGQTVALVGESGSGKSTVISLMERFYDPDLGHVLLDGVDIRKLRLKWLRQQLGLVSQDPALFNVSIRENIAYGKQGQVADEEIEAAARAANVHNFVASLPQGYHTPAGERGRHLSGGQRQRIAIARVILKNPKVLLLDEATSALDSESEQLVQEALERIMVARSTIVVAHRLSTVRNADVIAVISDGKILELGSHDTLKRNAGSYASLVRLHQSSP